MTTIRDYAREHNVSYEAIRKQIAKSREDLEGHIITKGKTKYLDDFAVEYLDQRRKESPVSVVHWEETEVVRALRDQIDALKNELMTTQKRVIELQSDNQLMIEAKTKYDLLLESSNEKSATIESLREDLTDARKERDEARADADQIRKEADQAKERSEKLKRERDAASKEAKSYKKSIFGLYRKIRE